MREKKYHYHNDERILLSNTTPVFLIESVRKIKATSIK
jgi:hypothetical protein